MEIVTGSTGEVHVTPIDDAVRNGNPGYLNKNVVFTYLRNFEYQIVTNNQVRIYSGYGMMQGRLFKIDGGEFDDVTITNGGQGYKRADLIVAHYHMESQTGFETIELQAIRGNAGDSYVDPSYSTGDVNAGEDCDFPLYRVRLNGLQIEGIDTLFQLVPDGGRLGVLEADYAAHKAKFNTLNVRTSLGSEGAPYLKDAPANGNVRPGVEGTLPVSHGGTGKSTAKDAANVLISNLDVNTSNPATTSAQDSNTYYIGTTQSGTVFHKKPLSALKEWISAFIETRGYGDMTKKTFTGQDDGTVIRPANGGTGQQSLQATRNAMGLGNTTGALPIANGGTGTTTAAGIRNAIGLGNSTGVLTADRGGTGQTTLQATRNAMGLGNTTGALPVANGGTGLASSPSMLTNLSSTSAVNIMQTSPRPGVTGTLSAANGGTGQTSLQATRNAMGLGNTTGVLPVANGGTGQSSLQATRNAMGLGNTTGALPVANGGTGATTAAAARTNLGVPSSSDVETTVNSLRDDINGKARKNHLSSSTDFGVGTASAYGHLKITDSPTTSHTVSSGVAASGKAVANTNAALEVIYQEIQNAYMPKGGGTFLGPVAFHGINGNPQISNLGTTARLYIGNDVQAEEGTAFYSSTSGGNVRLYNRGTGFYTSIVHNGHVLSDNRSLYLPDKVGTIQVGTPSSRRVKENIHDMTEERAKKLLDLDIVNFDYIGTFNGGLKDQSGVIAEDAIKVIPEAVYISPNYDETKPIDEIENPSLEVDYRQYIPYLIKMVQMQQKEIEELKAALNK